MPNVGLELTTLRLRVNMLHLLSQLGTPQNFSSLTCFFHPVMCLGGRLSAPFSPTAAKRSMGGTHQFDGPVPFDGYFGAFLVTQPPGAHEPKLIFVEFGGWKSWS